MAHAMVRKRRRRLKSIRNSVTANTIDWFECGGVEIHDRYAVEDSFSNDRQPFHNIGSCCRMPGKIISTGDLPETSIFVMLFNSPISPCFGFLPQAAQSIN